MVKDISLTELEQDRQDLQNMLMTEQQKLIAAQEACNRIEGALTYNAQCVDYARGERERSGPEESVSQTNKK